MFGLPAGAKRRPLPLLSWEVDDDELDSFAHVDSFSQSTAPPCSSNLRRHATVELYMLLVLTQQSTCALSPNEDCSRAPKTPVTDGTASHLWKASTLPGLRVWLQLQLMQE